MREVRYYVFLLLSLYNYITIIYRNGQLQNGQYDEVDDVPT